MSNPDIRIFRTPPLIWGAFFSRPNRFLVMVKLRDNLVVPAHLPNPGRLQELFLPDVPVALLPLKAKTGETGKQSLRRTSYTLVAVEKDGEPVLLHTHWSNQVVFNLLDTKALPVLRDATVIRRETRLPELKMADKKSADGGHGKGRNSRIDFLLENGGAKIYLEVKSCTAFYNRIAMFPDAPTLRGRRHLLHLNMLNDQNSALNTNCRGAVMFLIHALNNHCFIPDYHTDPVFSGTLLEVRDNMDVYPVAIGWKRMEDGSLAIKDNPRLLPVPWEQVKVENHDRGAYMLLIHLKQPVEVLVGALGRLFFPEGWYIYIGSAMKNLDARIKRHLRKKKKMHWHVDYLLAVADLINAFPIRSSVDIECEMSAELSRVFDVKISGFGSSDCRCKTHLFHASDNPMHIADFHRILGAFRTNQVWPVNADLHN